MPAPAALIALAARLGIRGAKKIIEKHGIPRLKTKINFELKTKRISGSIKRGKEKFLSKEGQDKFKKRLDKYSKDLKATRKSKNKKVDAGLSIKKGK